jgi:hypothetical protein
MVKEVKDIRIIERYPDFRGDGEQRVGVKMVPSTHVIGEKLNTQFIRNEY